MYQYHSSWARLKNQGQYRTEDLGNTPLSEIFRQYDHVYLYLTHTHTPGQVLGLDLHQMEAALAPVTATVINWLSILGTTSLPTELPAKQRHIKAVTYTDARKAGCYLQRVYQHSHPESEYPLDDKRNLLIQSPSADDGYVTFYNNHLVTLGGYIHRSEHTAHGMLVPHAIDTLETSGVDTVGLMSFAAMGGVQQVHLEESSIQPDGNGNPLGKRFAIDFPESIGDKSVGVVLLGRLILDTSIVRKFNDRRVLVDLERVDLESLYQHVRTDLRLDSLPLSPVRGQQDTVLISQLRSDDAIRAIMALSQSMVVVFDAPRLTEDFFPLANSDVSGRAFSDHKPTEPVIGACGLYVDYWTQVDWGRYVLNFPEQWVRRYFHDTYAGNDRTVTTGHHTTVQPRYTPHFRRHRLETQSME